ncbi:MAG: DUF1273 domain-containing protein [Prevotella sp.]|jgi:uncharacterized phage-like protein YoqJ|nr:DUF1273 domain-containing protein [Prevotella sp.]
MQTIHIDKSKTAAFTGHRYMNMDDSALKDGLTHIIREQYHNGYTSFITGVVRGFDLLACEAVLELQKIYPGIMIGCIYKLVHQSLTGYFHH